MPASFRSRAATVTSSALLTKPLGKLGIFLLPACILVGFVVATAIPSMAGMSAAVGPTLIPLLVRAGFRPAMAAAAVASCVMAGYFNPGVSHNHRSSPSSPAWR